MNKKVKLFKSIFQNNADAVMPSTVCIDNINCSTKSDTQPVMTEEMFVPLCGQIWDKAKIKYHKKRKSVSLEFAEWCAVTYNYLPNDDILCKRFLVCDLKGKWAHPNLAQDIKENWKTTKELYTKWVDLKRKG